MATPASGSKSILAAQLHHVVESHTDKKPGLRNRIGDALNCDRLSMNSFAKPFDPNTALCGLWDEIFAKLDAFGLRATSLAFSSCSRPGM
jgi:hypothetical protein